MSRPAEKTLLTILRIGLFLVLLSHVIYSNSFIFPYIVPRAIYFQILIEVLFAIAAILVFFAPHHRQRLTNIAKAVLFFFVVAVLTTITSADPSKSFIGSIERSFGLFHMLHFGILFFVATVAITSEKLWKAIFIASILVGLYVSIDFLAALAGSAGSSVASVMGNPTFLGGFLIFQLFFAATLLREQKKLIYKLLLGAVMLIFVMALFASHVRGAFVGFAAGLLFLAVYYALQNKGLRPLLMAILCIFIAGYSLLFINRADPKLADNAIVQRLTNFSMQDETIRARFSMWRMAISGLKERPLVGWGQENYSLVFNLHFDPSFEDAKVAEAWEDRAHNIIFDELTTGGILGLSAFFLLIAAMLWTVRRHPLALSLIVAYVTQSLFGVETLNTYLPLFLFLAYSDFCTAKNSVSHEAQAARLARAPLPAYGGSAAVIILIVIPSIFISMRVLRGNEEMHFAIVNMAQNNFPAFQANYAAGKKLLFYFPAMEGEAVTTINGVLFQAALKFSQAKTYSLFATPLTSDLERLAARNPAEQRFGFMLANSYMLLGAETGNSALLDKSEATINRLLASAPSRKIYLETANRLKLFRTQFHK